jgi:two-component system response regulator AtoC
MSHALIVEDDADSAETMAALIATQGFTVATARTLRDARRQIALQQPDMILLDLQLPDGNGMESVLRPATGGAVRNRADHGSCQPRELDPGAAPGRRRLPVKPVNLTQLQGILSRVMPPAALQAEVDTLNAPSGRNQRPLRPALGPLAGDAAHLPADFARVAGTSVTVLVTGESGTGKEVVARSCMISRAAARGPFSPSIAARSRPT